MKEKLKTSSFWLGVISPTKTALSFPMLSSMEQYCYKKVCKGSKNLRDIQIKKRKDTNDKQKRILLDSTKVA